MTPSNRFWAGLALTVAIAATVGAIGAIAARRLSTPQRSEAATLPKSALMVVQATLYCMRHNDVACMSRLMDPVALREFRATTYTIGDGLTSDSRLQYLIDKTPEQILAMDDGQFYTALADRQNERVGKVVVLRVEPIGSVAEGDKRYHVLYRSRTRIAQQIETEAVGLFTIDRVGDHWKLALNQETVATIDALKQIRAKIKAENNGQGGALPESRPEASAPSAASGAH